MTTRPTLSQPRSQALMQTGHPLAQRALSSAVAAAVLCLTLSPAPLVYAQSAKRPARTASSAQQTPVTVNFVNAEIEGVARAMGAMLKQQFVVDPRVKGTITLYSEDPLTPREAYLNFLAALRGQGFTVVESGGLYKVVPEADAKLQSDTVSTGAVARKGDQIITQIFKINHENANNLVPVLRPLISPNNTINANPGNNTLVITDYADNLQRIAKIIAAMDTASAGETEVIVLKHTVASDLATVVQKLSDAGGGAPGAAPAVGGSAPAIMIDSRSNSLIVRAPNAARMASIRSLIEKLDRPPPAGTAAGNIYVVHLKNADSTKLAAVLRAAFAANASAGGAGGGGGSTPTPVAAAPVAAGGANASTTPVAASAGPSTGGFIQADPSTNSLIITAAEPLYRQLRAVIEQLDSRRAQVYIESMIVKVNAQKIVDVGVQWQGMMGQKGDNTITAGGTNFSNPGNIITLSGAATTGRTGLAQAVGAIPGGFNIGVLKKIGDFYTLGALAKFLETNADANILSTPNLIALDNEEAKIVIGQNVPFLTGSFSNTGGAGSVNPFQTIERKDVGLTLRVRPQIGESGTVRMTIYQENSSVVSSNAQGITTDKSAIETTVVVDDGQMMVLGGLIADEYKGSVEKVPLLGDIPYLGALFRYDNRKREKTNLMVFLRPVVIRDQQSANDLTVTRYDAIRAQQQQLQPQGNILQPIREAPVLPPAFNADGSPITLRPSRLTPIQAPASAPAKAAN